MSCCCYGDALDAWCESSVFDPPVYISSLPDLVLYYEWGRRVPACPASE
jgi:hypothetical protein